jgi:hypothetical protein
MHNFKKYAVFLAAAVAIPAGGWFLTGPAEAAPGQQVCHKGNLVGSDSHVNNDGTLKHGDTWPVNGSCSGGTATTTPPVSSTPDETTSSTPVETTPVETTDTVPPTTPDETIPPSDTTPPTTPDETTTTTTTTTDDSYTTPPTSPSETTSTTPPDTITTTTTPPETTTTTTTPPVVTTTTTTPPVKTTTTTKPAPVKPTKPAKKRTELAHTGEGELPWQQFMGIGLAGWFALGLMLVAFTVRSRNKLAPHTKPTS